MTTPINVFHESVDDIPVLIAVLSKMRVAALLDQHFPTNGNRTGLSLGQTAVVWLTYLLSQGDHRLNQVEPWIATHQQTLTRCLGCPVEPRDGADDRLATVLDYVSVRENWVAFEAALNRRVLRVYDLQAQCVRIDTTTASSFVTPDGLFQLGYSKDHRPDLPQVKIALSTLDPLGLPFTVTVVGGQEADDPLYLPEIAQARRSVGRRQLTYVGDSKMAALATRADIAAHGDYYLCPLSATQLPTAELDQLLAPVFAQQQALTSVHARGEEDHADAPDLLAQGFEDTVRLSGKEQKGVVPKWDERRLVVRSLSFAASQEQSLRERLTRAQEEIVALNQRKQGKPVLRSAAQAQAAAEQIADAQRVREYLRIAVTRQVESRVKRAYGDRPATTVEQEQFTVTSVVEAEVLERSVRRLGWRVYATNQPAAELSLEQAVWAYREQYLVEQSFGRLKGCSLSLTPFYLAREDRVVGLILLLTIALRVLTLAQYVVREKLKEQGETLTGIYAGQPGRQTARPTTEMLLRAFRGVTLSRITLHAETHWHLTLLSDTQKRILKLLGLSPRLFAQLLPAIQKTVF